MPDLLLSDSPHLILGAVLGAELARQYVRSWS